MAGKGAGDGASGQGIGDKKTLYLHCNALVLKRLVVSLEVQCGGIPGSFQLGVVVTESQLHVAPPGPVNMQY